MVQQGTRQTYADYKAFMKRPENRDRLFELFDGRIIERLGSELRGLAVARLCGFLGEYLEQNPIGHAQVSVLCHIQGDAYNAVEPDLSVDKDLATPVVKTGAVPRLPELCIEVESEEDTVDSLHHKTDFYLRNGAKMVWLVFLLDRRVEVYVPDADVITLSEQGTLDGGEVLPGFSLKVADIFRMP